jgi:hypothetical protein
MTKRKDIVAATPFQLATLAAMLLSQRPSRYVTAELRDEAIHSAWSLLKASRDFLEETPNKANAWD